MKELPILFSPPMVRAILDGSKTQTRRVVKLPDNARDVQYYAPPSGRSQPGWADPGVNYWTPDISGATVSNHIDPCPYGQSGDRLWVRETWNHENYPYGPDDPDCCFFYRADYLDDPLGPDLELSEDGIRRKWIPPIHMPRWASRIDLEITGVRVERLNSISEQDAIREGAPGYEEGTDAPPPDEFHEWCYRSSFRRLWESINGPGSWDANPWVWVIEFRRIK